MLVAITAAYRRFALTELWAIHTASLGFDAVVCAYTETGTLAVMHGLAGTLHAAEVPNDPLAGKFNAALDGAMELGATRIMILPSDDFVSQEWMEVARNTEEDYIVPHACGVYSPATSQAYAITKLSMGTLKFGAARVVSRRAIEAVGGELWPPTLNKGLDTASHHRLEAAGIKHQVVPTSTIPVTDVKTQENIWGFETWRSGSKDISPDEALHMVSPDIRENLKAIR